MVIGEKEWCYLPYVLPQVVIKGSIDFPGYNLDQGWMRNERWSLSDFVNQSAGWMPADAGVSPEAPEQLAQHDPAVVAWAGCLRDAYVLTLQTGSLATGVAARYVGRNDMRGGWRAFIRAMRNQELVAANDAIGLIRAGRVWRSGGAIGIAFAAGVTIGASAACAYDSSYYNH